MSLPDEALALHARSLADLAEQMMELAALRRAVCLAAAVRDRPKGARRSAGRAARPLMRSSLRTVRPAAEEAGQVGLAQGERQGADIVAVEQALA
jgi:hypothetical protein